MKKTISRTARIKKLPGRIRNSIAERFRKLIYSEEVYNEIGNVGQIRLFLITEGK
ncbi:hypothetical protein OAR19_00310 [bacterium]|nr:hypothetical protein [bacterium]MDC0977679.1 hypothetical protein [bacterium]